VPSGHLLALHVDQQCRLEQLLVQEPCDQSIQTRRSLVASTCIMGAVLQDNWFNLSSTYWRATLVNQAALLQTKICRLKS